MKKERTSLRLAELEPNTGQLEWLPKNPRQWTQDDIDRTAASIQRDFDFLEDRPLLVTPCGDKYVVFAGNLRQTAARTIGVDSMPAYIYTPEDEDDYLTIKRRAMLDNGSFGAWDWDALANEWDDLPLGDWGVPNWGHDTVDVGDLGIEPIASAGESLSGFTQMTFLFSRDDAEIVQGYIDTFGKDKLVEQIVEVCRTAEAK